MEINVAARLIGLAPSYWVSKFLLLVTLVAFCFEEKCFVLFKLVRILYTIRFKYKQCKRLLAGHAFLYELKMEMRAAVQLQIWTRNVMLNRKHLQKENMAASRIQAIVKGFLVRKKLPQIKEELHTQKLVRAATLIQVNVQC